MIAQDVSQGLVEQVGRGVQVGGRLRVVGKPALEDALVGPADFLVLLLGLVVLGRSQQPCESQTSPSAVSYVTR